MRREDGLDREEIPMLPVLLCCAAVIGLVLVVALTIAEVL